MKMPRFLESIYNLAAPQPGWHKSNHMHILNAFLWIALVLGAIAYLASLGSLIQKGEWVWLVIASLSYLWLVAVTILVRWLGSSLHEEQVLTATLENQCSELESQLHEQTQDLQKQITQINPATQNNQLLESSRANFQGSERLNRATRQIAQIHSAEQIFQLAGEALEQAPYVSTLFLPEQNQLRTIPLTASKSTQSIPEWLPIPKAEIERNLTSSDFILVSDLKDADSLPPALVAFIHKQGCDSVALLPLRRNAQLAALFAFGSQGFGDPRTTPLSPVSLQPFINFAEFVITALEKVQASETLAKQQVALETLNNIGEAITVDTDLGHLYPMIHRNVTQVMGEVNFLIAMYDSETRNITIPYAYERGEIINLPNMPLGEGLTSILIRTRQPLMLVEDTERRAAELGAKVVGATAKSWLGVPMIEGEEVIGALIVQDLDREHRFDETDQRLLVMLASQISIAIRNASILESSQRQAEQERLTSEINAKLWASTDVDTILRTAVHELGRTLQASEAVIQLEINE